jgi:hypothetical protein
MSILLCGQQSKALDARVIARPDGDSRASFVARTEHQAGDAARTLRLQQPVEACSGLRMLTERALRERERAHDVV